jgi:hypothetical protein
MTRTGWEPVIHCSRAISARNSIDMSLDDDQRAVLAAVVDRMVPAEEFPQVLQGDVAARLEERLGDDGLGRWLRGLVGESYTVYSTGFIEMHPGTRDEVLDRIEAENIRTDWQMDPTAFFGRMIDVVAEIIGA